MLENSLMGHPVRWTGASQGFLKFFQEIVLLISGKQPFLGNPRRQRRETVLHTNILAELGGRGRGLTQDTYQDRKMAEEIRGICQGGCDPTYCVSSQWASGQMEHWSASCSPPLLTYWSP